MKRLMGLVALLVAASGWVGAENKPAATEPVVWGMLSGHTGCVVFAEGHATKGRFYGVMVTTKTTGKLTLVEAQHTDFAEKEVLETQENLDRLMQMAQKDRIKFVKIPEKYTPELLGKARTACGAGTA